MTHRKPRAYIDMTNLKYKPTDQRRGSDPAEETYLARIGERLRVIRTRRGMSRKVLSIASGVSERYLAEMERGTGNASLLVVRRLAAAMGVSVAELATDDADALIDAAATPQQSAEPSPEDPAGSDPVLGIAQRSDDQSDPKA
jgi:XRE family transcriptional regulator, aerobic/anaerobic benzoate catabolism transcriptional regulator